MSKRVKDHMESPTDDRYRLLFLVIASTTNRLDAPRTRKELNGIIREKVAQFDPPDRSWFVSTNNSFIVLRTVAAVASAARHGGNFWYLSVGVCVCVCVNVSGLGVSESGSVCVCVCVCVRVLTQTRLKTTRAFLCWALGNNLLPQSVLFLSDGALGLSAVGVEGNLDILF